MTPTALQIALSPQQFEVAAWYYVDGFTLAEIAAFLKCSRPSVADRLAKIRRKLAKAGIATPARTTRFVPTRKGVALLGDNDVRVVERLR